MIDRIIRFLEDWQLIGWHRFKCNLGFHRRARNATCLRCRTTLGPKPKSNYEPPWPYDPEDPSKYDTVES